MDNLWYFYCGGTRIIELVVALHSTRKFWKGRIGVALDPISQPLLSQIPADIEVKVLPYAARNGTEHMQQRWRGIKLFDYDRVVASDMDVIVNRDASGCFEVMHPGLEYITTYSGMNVMPEERSSLKNRFKTFNPNIRPGNQIYVNMGLFGLNQGYPHIDEFISICPHFQGSRCMAEEYAISYICQVNGHKAFWPRNDVFVNRTRVYKSNPVVWHAILGRFRVSGQWRKEWFECKREDYMGVGDPKISDAMEPGISAWPEFF
jgi:hypothetical protein